MPPTWPTLELSNQLLIMEYFETWKYKELQSDIEFHTSLKGKSIKQQYQTAKQQFT